MADLNKLAEDIVGLTLLQAQELKTILKDSTASSRLLAALS
jgi:large subunit ribosomal protein L7/L12